MWSQYFPLFSSRFHSLCDITFAVKIFTFIGYKANIQNINDLQNTTRMILSIWNDQWPKNLDILANPTMWHVLRIFCFSNLS